MAAEAERIEEIRVMIELGEEEGDNSLLDEAQRLLNESDGDIEDLELRILLSKERDRNNAITRVFLPAPDYDNSNFLTCHQRGDHPHQFQSRDKTLSYALISLHFTRQATQQPETDSEQNSLETAGVVLGMAK